MRYRLALAAGALAATIGGAAVMRGGAAETFDAAAWRALADEAEAGEAGRSAMLEAAVAEVRPGMDRAELIALLGEPSETEGDRLIWEAGWNTIQFAWLEVLLDEGGAVVEATARYD